MTIRPASASPALPDADDDGPALPDTVIRHLGRLLRAVYEQEAYEAYTADRFAGLLAELGAVLDGMDRTAAEFQAALLATEPTLRRFAQSLTRNTATADDLVQETLLRAWRSRTGFQLGTNLQAWLFTIARNVFYSASRRYGREVNDNEGTFAERLTSPPAQGGHLDLQDMRSALDRLTPTMREAVTLVAVQDLTYEEAAAVMGCRTGTVKSRVSRARNQLALLLGYTGAEIGQDGLTLSALRRAD